MNKLLCAGCLHSPHPDQGLEHGQQPRTSLSPHPRAPYHLGPLPSPLILLTWFLCHLLPTYVLFTTEFYPFGTLYP